MDDTTMMQPTPVERRSLWRRWWSLAWYEHIATAIAATNLLATVAFAIALLVVGGTFFLDPGQDLTGFARLLAFLIFLIGIVVFAKGMVVLGLGVIQAIGIYLIVARYSAGPIVTASALIGSAIAVLVLETPLSLAIRLPVAIFWFAGAAFAGVSWWARRPRAAG